MIQRLQVSYLYIGHEMILLFTNVHWTDMNYHDSEPKNRPTFQELLERLKDLQRQYTIQFKQNTAMQDLPPW